MSLFGVLRSPVAVTVTEAQREYYAVVDRGETVKTIPADVRVTLTAEYSVMPPTPLGVLESMSRTLQNLRSSLTRSRR